jgi:hypothetical protein
VTAPRSVCLRCGGPKAAYDAICASCGHVPEGEGLLVAWLLSEAHLDGAGLEAAAARVRAGEVIRPSEKMLDRARRALGRHAAEDAGLDVGARATLLATSLLLTPLVGLTAAWWWRETRPRAAAQALAMSAPVSVAMLVAVAWAWLAPP